MSRNPGDRTDDPRTDRRGETAEEGRQPRPTDDERVGATDPGSVDGATAGDRIASRFTETAVRGGIALLGVALVILAIGEIVGIPLLSMFVDFLTSSLGVWLFVAAIGLMLIAAASRSWSLTSSME